jgi:hypothetical protein
MRREDKYVEPDTKKQGALIDKWFAGKGSVNAKREVPSASKTRPEPKPKAPGETFLGAPIRKVMGKGKVHYGGSSG